MFRPIPPCLSAILLLLLGFTKLVAQTPVPLGAGSYASEVPVSGYYTDAYFGLPAAQVEPLTAAPALYNSLHLDPALVGTPIPTNQWWTDLLAANRSYLISGTDEHVMQQDAFGGNMWFYPGMLAPRSYGLDLYFPNAWKAPNANGSPQGGFDKGPALQIRGDRGFSIPPEDILIADFEGATFPAGWTVTTFAGYTNAFPGGPAQSTWTGQSPTPTGYLGSGYANTFLTSSGSGADTRRGILTSAPFTVQKQFIHLLVGGGSDVTNTVVRLKVAGNIVATAVGQQSGTLRWVSWNVSAYLSQTATVEIVDTSSAGWGFIMCDEIVQSDASNPAGRYGRDMAATSSVVTKWGDWNVDFKLPDASGNIVGVTMARGIPFTWTTWSGGVKPRLQTGSTTFYGLDNLPINTSGGSFTASAFSFVYQGRSFGVFLPDATVVNVTSTEAAPQLSGADNYMVIGYLPSTTDLAAYASVAYARPTDTRITWSHDPVQGVVNTTWNITTTSLKGTNLDTIQGWLPHPYRTTAHALSFQPQTYLTPRGVMKCATGHAFQIAFPFKGMVPVLPAPPVAAVANPYQPARMATYMNQFNPGSMIGDTYWGGKALAFCAQNMARAQQMGDAANYNRLRSALKTALTNWFTYTPGETNGYFTTYPNWHAFIGFDASYGSQAFNDLHFHYGYFAVAGATLGMCDPQFMADYGPMLKAIAKCYGNWDRADTSEPFLRTFDIWAGHSNAGGLSSGNGNNQESSSEAMQSWGGLFLLGSTMGDGDMAAAGAMGFAMESCSVNEYWQDIYRTNFPASYNRAGNGILGADSYAYGTYFSGDPAWVYAIQYSPANHWNNYLTRAQPATVVAKYQGMWTERLNWCHGQTLWNNTTAYTQGTWVQYNDRIYSASAAVAAGGIAPGQPGALWNREADCSKPEADTLGDSPGHVVMCYQALWDHENSAAQFDSYFTANATIAGGQAVSTYYLIHALRAMGDQDFTYTTSLPTSAIYVNATTGARTYVVYNPSPTTQTVTVYQNGVSVGTMTVPARVTVATQNANYSAAAPPIPTNAVSTGLAALSWTGSPLATGYHVRRATNFAAPYTIVATTDNATYTDAGLNGGATYYYTFSAINSVGESADSAPLSVTIVSDAPANLTISLSNGKPVLNWNASTGASSYKVKRANSINGTYAIVGIPSVTTFTDTSAASGTTYFYTVLTVNAGGDGAASAPVSINTITPPAIPTNFKASLGNGSVALTWTAPSGNPTGYNIKRGTLSSGPYSTIGTSTVTSFSDTSLSNGLTYFYIVTATNGGGESAPSAEASVTVLAAPALAINCGGSSVGQFGADAGFTGGNSTNVTTAIVTTGLVNPAPQSVYQSNRFGNSTYTLGGLTSGVTYNVRLHFAETYWTAAGQRTFHININGTRVATSFDIFAAVGARYKAVIREFSAAANASGQVVVQFVTAIDNAQCNGIEIREPRSAAPGNVTAVGGTAQIALNWNAVATATNYLVKRAATSGGPFTILDSVTGTSFTDTGLTAGTPLYYTISAINAGGESPDSTVVNAVPSMTYAAFRQLYFSAAQIADANISGPAADPNGDGVSNLLAYAFNANPWTSAVLSLPTSQIVNGYLTVSFTRRKAPTDLTYTVEVSGTLGGWDSGTAYTTEISATTIDAANEQVAVRDNTPTSAGKRFIRVKVQ